MSSRFGPSELRRSYDNALQSGALDAFRKRRWTRAAEFAGWLEQDALASLQPQQALLLYRASGGRDTASFCANPIEELRDSLDFLLYDTIKLEGRFDECVNDGGAYKLSGAGKEFVTWLLCLRNPYLFGVWNSNAERMLRGMGAYPEAMRRGPMGIRYLDLLEALARVQFQVGLPDFIEVDSLAWLSTRPRRRESEPAQRDET